MRLSVQKSALVTLCFYLFLESLALAQVDTAWVRRYSGSFPFSSRDKGVAIAIDDSGNVYVTGFSEGLGTSEDGATLKYTPNGDTAWVARYNGPGNSSDGFGAIAVDDSGNVYVTGGSLGSGTSYDFATIKYAANGDTLWVRRYNGPPGTSQDYASGLAIDTAGNVYVTGISQGSGTGYDYATIKYAPNGDTLWVRRYSGPGNSTEWAEALALDESGNVYVTGYTHSIGSSQDYATVKYAPNGDTAWVRRYNGPGDSSDQAVAMAVDDSGNVYVTGGSLGSGTSYDFATIKYASNGDTAWVRRYNGSVTGEDRATDMAVDDSGNVYVTGYSDVVGSGFLPSDFVTLKYSPNGGLAWVRTYNGPQDGLDIPRAMTLDDSGNIYVTGSIETDPTIDTSSFLPMDYATLKYAPNGDLAWVKTYKGPGFGVDIAYAVAVDDSGSVYVTGETDGTGGDIYWDYTTIKYVQIACSAQPGDANANGTLTLSDIISTVNYIFDKSGYPVCGSANKICWLSELLCRGDWDGSTTVTLSDAIRGVNKLFNKPGGPWDALPSGVCCLP